ncbi:MAG: hypothetical protein Q9184_004723 [Pyrenodesmia sp. 2 TL-2023]
MESTNKDRSLGPVAQNPVIVITSPPSVGRLQASPPPMSDITQELSVMDLDRGPKDPASPQDVTSKTERSHSWRDLTRQAFVNRAAPFRAGATQAEQRKLLQERRFLKRDNRLYEIAHDEKAKPAKRKEAIDKLRSLGKLSKAEAEKLGKPRPKLPSSNRVSKKQLLTRKAKATIKASEVARTKALERAVGKLDLSGGQPSQSSSQQPLLSLAHVKHIISEPSAETSFSLFLRYHKDPPCANQISQKDQRRLAVLQTAEQILQTKAREAGSIEAALTYQDERVAYFDELKALRTQESFLGDQHIGNPKASSFQDGENYPLKCICGSYHDDGNTVICEHCMTRQHAECFYFVEGATPNVNESDHYCADCKPRRLDIRGAIERQKLRLEEALAGGRIVKTRSKQRGAQDPRRNDIIERDRVRQANEPHVRPKLYDSYRPAHDAPNSASSRSLRGNSAVFTPLVGGGDYYHPRPIRRFVLHNSPPNIPSHSGGPRLIDSYRPAYNTQQPPSESNNRVETANGERQAGGSLEKLGPPNP